MVRGSGRHLGGSGRRWWIVRRKSRLPQSSTPRDYGPPTTPYGLPAIPASYITDDNAKWILEKLGRDRNQAFDFIEQMGLGHEFLEWRQHK